MARITSWNKIIDISLAHCKNRVTYPFQPENELKTILQNDKQRTMLAEYLKNIIYIICSTHYTILRNIKSDEYDIAHNAFIYLWNKIDGLEQKNTLEYYMIVRATNAIFRQIRKHQEASKKDLMLQTRIMERDSSYNNQLDRHDPFVTYLLNKLTPKEQLIMQWSVGGLEVSETFFYLNWEVKNKIQYKLYHKKLQRLLDHLQPKLRQLRILYELNMNLSNL